MRYQRLSEFLASRGLTFWQWLAIARDYDTRHWAMYYEFNRQESRND